MEASEPGRRLAAGGIFSLPSKYIIDSPFLWCLMALMVVFMIIVDRLQMLADSWVDGEHSKKVFMERLNAEVQMFGIVAITLFLFQYAILELTDDQNKQFHYVDLMCSIGACTLILFGGGLMVFITRITRMYRLGMQQDVAKYMRFYLSASTFMAKWSVPYDFSFAHYMKDNMIVAIAQLITLDYVPWIVMLGPIALGIIISSFTNAEKLDASVKVMVFTLYNAVWALLGLSFGILVRIKVSKFHEHMGAFNDEAMAKVRKLVEERKEQEGGKLTDVLGEFAEKLGDVSREVLKLSPEPLFFSPWLSNRCLQAGSVGLSLNFALYVTHFIAVINTNQLSSAWHVVNLVTFVAGFTFIPWTLINLTEIHAVFHPNPEVMAHCWRSAERTLADAQYIYKKLEDSVIEGNTTLEILDGFMQKIETDEKLSVKRFLQGLGVPADKSMVRRLKNHMDTDNNGLVTYAEFFNCINGDPSNMSEKNGAKDLLVCMRSHAHAALASRTNSCQSLLSIASRTPPAAQVYSFSTRMPGAWPRSSPEAIKAQHLAVLV